MRKPDLVCIGVQKAGTTWLHHVFGARADVWVPPFKELHFFDHKFVPANRQWTLQHVRKGVARAREAHIRDCGTPNSDYIRYLDSLIQKPILNGNWYQRVFSRAQRNQLCMDVTPEYCTIPPEGVEFVDRFLKRSKFVVIVRSPVDRALSQIRMNASRAAKHPKSDAEWEKLALNNKVLNRARYTSFIPRWEAVFGHQRLLYLPYGQISKRPLDLLRSVEKFTGLQPASYERAQEVLHKTKDIHVPETVKNKLKDLLLPEEQFLERHFGVDFSKQA